MPLRPGHTLVIPKIHTPRVSELAPEFAAATGIAVSKVARALAEGRSHFGLLATQSLKQRNNRDIALDNTGLNVVCNQEYAQAVPHVSTTSL